MQLTEFLIKEFIDVSKRKTSLRGFDLSSRDTGSTGTILRTNINMTY